MGKVTETFVIENFKMIPIHAFDISRTWESWYTWPNKFGVSKICIN